ncbi:hypothetical protein [Lysinibacter sp. HNR]|uniref:phage major capsid protein n=1 Tax=Lysinibacter sp. HNR TaxID=3031408 RepID=UPI002435F410|nr:hypothetical protein [Lysinibacter sp. HNR]WGD38480.1 hypothetical protein FrondiHNR_06105 [Lysinibacter sp. HNR]
MGYTYPVRHPEGKLTTEQLHMLLTNKQAIAKRLADLTKMQFIADYLLQGRLDATGGGIFYETGEEIFASDSPEAITPLGEYPLVTLDDGEIASARTIKWGLDTIISDEKIARQGIGYINKALLRVSNTVVRHVDRVAMAVIASKVTTSFAAGPWTSAGKAVKSILTIQAERAEMGTGLELETAVLRADQYAEIIAMLIDDKALPREQGETAIAGNLPVNALGLTWATTPHFQGADPLLLDRDQLGGMAEEKIGGPGYASAGGVGVESKIIRDDDTEGYKVRGRRVTVPVVLEPLAGVKLTGTGL